jgi:hypothetical protein
MIDSALKVGDVVKLKGRFHETARYAIILEIRKAESFGKDGWISFDYVVMTDKNTLTHISESCVEKIYSILK